MMTAGTELLEEEGLGIGAVDLTFKRVFDRVLATSGVRLTNGSVIRRVWENQAEFQDDVLAAIARSGDSSGELDDTATALLAVFESIELATPEDRVRGLSEMCRVGGEATLRTLVDSGTWSLWVGVWVLAVTGPPSSRGSGIRSESRLIRKGHRYCDRRDRTERSRAGPCSAWVSRRWPSTTSRSTRTGPFLRYLARSSPSSADFRPDSHQQPDSGTMVGCPKVKTNAPCGAAAKSSETY